MVPAKAVALLLLLGSAKANHKENRPPKKNDSNSNSSSKSKNSRVTYSQYDAFYEDKNGADTLSLPNVDYGDQKNSGYYDYLDLFDDDKKEVEYEYYTVTSTMTTTTTSFDYGSDTYVGLNIDGVGLNVESNDMVDTEASKLKEEKKSELVEGHGDSAHHESAPADPNIQENMFSMVNTALSNIIQPRRFNSETDKPLPPIRDYLFKYGCYCFPEVFDGTGPRFSYSGDPLDQFDSLCRDLYRAQKCLRWDFEDENKNCDTGSDYDWYKNLYIHQNMNNLSAKQQREQVICGSRNPKDNVHNDHEHENARPVQNACKIDNCELEIEFIKNIVQLIDDGIEKNDRYHMFDKDYKNNCYHRGGYMDANSVSYNKCCGQGFTRRPYSELHFKCGDEGLYKI